MLATILLAVAVILLGAGVYPSNRTVAGLVVLFAVLALLATVFRWAPL